MSQQPRNRELGEHLEDLVIQHIPELDRARERLDDPHWTWDAITTTTIQPGHSVVRVQGELEIPSGTPIEIKAAAHSTSNGSQRDTPGRYYLRSTQHRELERVDAAYCFVVYTDPTDPDLESVTIIPAARVSGLIEWYDVESRGVEAAKIAWPRIVPRGSTA